MTALSPQNQRKTSFVFEANNHTNDLLWLPVFYTNYTVLNENFPPTELTPYLLLPFYVIEGCHICGEACYAPDRSEATLRCNANDCIHQKSFVSYSLCSLSFLSQTPAIPWQALRCVTASISHCQRYPYQERQGALGMTCQVSASSRLPVPLCLARFFVLIL